jgi:hypothetical protein
MSNPALFVPNLGVLHGQNVFPVPMLPAIVAAWASIVPLVAHLVPNDFDHQLAGDVSLSGRVGLDFDLFPKLGTLRSLRQLLRDGQDFLDHSARQARSMTIFDVNWGSVFPPANGAACAIIISHATRGLSIKNIAQRLPQTTPCGRITSSNFRRPQTLYVLNFSRRVTRRWSILAILRQLAISATAAYLLCAMMVATAICLALFECYGTGVVLVSTSLARIVCRFVRLKRPSSILHNNKLHKACMLAAVHVNSNTWYLFTGDRGIVDYLLNKPMVEFESQAWLGPILATLHYIQFLAITFVTAQQGWDGICLVLLMVVSAVYEHLNSDSARAEHWLQSEGIDINTQGYAFSGRSQMIGAIQVFSGTKVTHWMDSIIVDCPRRQAWLKKLGEKNNEGPNGSSDDLAELDSFSKTWVMEQASLATKAGRLLVRSIPSVR